MGYQAVRGRQWREEDPDRHDHMTLRGLLIALFGLTVQLIAQPFRKRTDDAIASVVRLMLVLFFILGIMVKLCDIDDPNAIHSLLDARIEASDFCFTLVGMQTAEAVAWLMLLSLIHI